MATFNVLVGIGIAVVAALPVFWIRSKPKRLIALVIALVLGMGGAKLSNQFRYPEYLSWRFEEELKKQPLFDMIAKNHPKEFARFIQKVKQTLRENEDTALVSSYSAEFVNSIFYQHLQHAPDDNIVLYLKATIDLYQHLNGKDPRAVVKLESANNTIAFDLNTLWEDKDFRALLSHLLDTKRYVIEAGIKSPHQPEDGAKADALLQGVLNELVAKYGDSVVTNVFSSTDTTVPPNVGAQVIIQFYSNILGTGKENAGMIMRHIARIKAQKEQSQVDKVKEEETKKDAKP